MMRFICDPNLILTHTTGKPPRREILIVDPTISLTHKVRTQLYVAHRLEEQKRLVDQVNRAKANDSSLDPLVMSLTPEHAKEKSLVAKDIGSNWMRRIEGSHRFLGLQFHDLVSSVGLASQMAILYRTSSWSAHGHDAHRHADFDGEGFGLSLSPEDINTEAGLRFTGQSFIDCLRSLVFVGIAPWTMDDLRTLWHPSMTR